MAKLLMKNYPLFFSLILIGSGIHGQPSIKVFGYEQESSRGTVAANVKDEKGNPLKKAATQKNYFIYLSLKQKYIVTPLQVFIDGKAFPADANIIETTPVEYINNNILSHPEKTTLVPKTDDKVIQLKIADTVQVKKTSTLQKLTNKNEVVVSYAWKQKKYFAVLKKLKKLDPVLNE
jgi:hypothetical protein